MIESTLIHKHKYRGVRIDEEQRRSKTQFVPHDETGRLPFQFGTLEAAQKYVDECLAKSGKMSGGPAAPAF